MLDIIVSDNGIIELFGSPINKGNKSYWANKLKKQQCPYLGKKCIKVRKSEPEISIGSCVVKYGREAKSIIICPFRLLEARQIFVDAIHLLTLHEPGNELHILPEISVPGGSVDYFLVSVRKGIPIDFVGIELQTCDTTGTVWPLRQQFLFGKNLIDKSNTVTYKPFGINWKMTAKTILVQLHHKVITFEHLSKHLLLVTQNLLFEYMQREFSFGHFNNPRLGDTVHFHNYLFVSDSPGNHLQLDSRFSTDAAGIAKALGLQKEAAVELEALLRDIEKKISRKTLWTPS